uniref:Uncharacterized protein n=1 Tax=Tetranychus urticae TaxID=32264 RepID=T1KNI5_TETUR
MDNCYLFNNSSAYLQLSSLPCNHKIIQNYINCIKRSRDSFLFEQHQEQYENKYSCKLSLENNARYCRFPHFSHGADPDC